MKAAIISQESISSKWTFEAMKKYFDEVDSLNLKDIEISLGTKANILYKEEQLKEYDCIFVKGSFRYAEILSSITALYQNKIYLPIEMRAFSIAHDKILTHIYLQLHNVPQPTTFFVPTAEAGRKILKSVNFPIIMKLPRGTQGKGVMFADSYASASSILDTLQTLNQPFLIQEYIETDGEDVRLIVVGDRVVGGMKRKAIDLEKRANIHAGGQGLLFKPDAYLQKIAINSAKAVGAEICGVDILDTIKGPVVLEVNISPGLQGITKVSGIDVADIIAKHLAKRTEESISIRKDNNKKNVMSELWINPMIDKKESKQEIIGPLDFRGDRVLLPPIVKSIAKFNETDEFSMKIEEGKVVIEKFKL
jgi:ribosomal protein S6--L-glutamate ligase